MKKEEDENSKPIKKRKYLKQRKAISKVTLFLHTINNILRLMERN